MERIVNDNRARSSFKGTNLEKIQREFLWGDLEEKR